MAKKTSDRSIVTTSVLNSKKSGGARFNVDFIKLVANLKAAGLSDVYIAQVLQCKPATIKRWRNKYDELEKAYQDGKSTAFQQLVATAYQIATGYDYAEYDEKYERKTGTDGKVYMELVERKKKLKHQKPDHNLLIFLLINLSKGEFTNTKKVEVDQQTTQRKINVTASVSSEQIERLAGEALMGVVAEKKAKQVLSEVIDAEIRPDKSEHPRSIPEDSAKGSSGECGF